MDNFGKVVSQYILSLILLIAGLLFLFKYLGSSGLTSQPGTLLLGSLLLIFLGIIIMPAVLGRLSQKVVPVLAILGTVLAIVMGYMVYNSVTSEIDFQAKKSAIDSTTIQRLKDIREIQKEYRKVNGRYTDSFDDLMAFVNKKVVPEIYEIGELTVDTITQAELIEQGYVISKADVDSVSSALELTPDEFLADVAAHKNLYQLKDTTFLSLMQTIFSDEARLKGNLPPLNLDSLPFSPNSGERFVMKTSVTEVAGARTPTVYVKDPTPFGREKVKKDTLSFGSLSEAHTDGSWK